MIIPSIGHAVVVKTTKDTHLGLSLMMRRRDLVVSNISPDSPYKKTWLKVGYEILSMNGKHFYDADKAVDYLKQVEGTIDIVASNHPFPSGGNLTYVKNNPRELINSMEFSRLNENLVQVSHIHSRGPFAATNEQVGDVVLTINNKVVADPTVASRLLFSCEEDYVWILTLSRKKFLEAAVHKMILRQDKSKPWTKPEWVGPNKIRIGRQDWNTKVTLSFDMGGVCEVDDPWLFFEPKMINGDKSPFKVQYSDWYRNEVIPRVEEINEYLKANIENVEVAVRRSPYWEVSPDEAVVDKLDRLKKQRKAHALTEKEYAAAKYKLLGIRVLHHTDQEC